MKRCKSCGSPVSINDAWCKSCIEPIARTVAEVQRNLLGESIRAIQAASDLGNIPQAAWCAHWRLVEAIEETEDKIRREE